MSVNIKLCTCTDPDDVEQICIDHDIDIVIVGDTIVHCDNPDFLDGVLAALLHMDP